MIEDSIYDTSHQRDHIDALHQIAHLAKIGAASTDTVSGIKFMSAAQCSLFEVIHRLASEGVELAEGAGEHKITKRGGCNASEGVVSTTHDKS